MASAARALQQVTRAGAVLHFQGLERLPDPMLSTLVTALQVLREAMVGSNGRPLPAETEARGVGKAAFLRQLNRHVSDP